MTSEERQAIVHQVRQTHDPREPLDVQFERAIRLHPASARYASSSSAAAAAAVASPEEAARPAKSTTFSLLGDSVESRILAAQQQEPPRGRSVNASNNHKKRTGGKRYRLGDVHHDDPDAYMINGANRWSVNVKQSLATPATTEQPRASEGHDQSEKKVKQVFITEGPVTFNMFNFDNANDWTLAVPAYMHRQHGSPAVQFAHKNVHPLWASLVDDAPEERIKAILGFLQRRLSEKQGEPYREGAIFTALRGVNPETDENVTQQVKVVFGPAQGTVNGHIVSIVACAPVQPVLLGSQFFLGRVGLPFKMTIPSPYDGKPLIADHNLIFVHDGHASLHNRIIVTLCMTPYGPVYCNFLFDHQEKLALILNFAHSIYAEAGNDNSTTALALTSAPAAATASPISSAPTATISVNNEYLRQVRSLGAHVDAPNYESDALTFALTTDPAAHFKQVEAEDNWFTRTWKRIKRGTIDKFTGAGGRTALLMQAETFQKSSVADKWKTAINMVTDPDFPATYNDSAFELIAVQVNGFHISPSTGVGDEESFSGIPGFVYAPNEEGVELEVLHVPLPTEVPLSLFYDTKARIYKEGTITIQTFKDNLFKDYLDVFSGKAIHFQFAGQTPTRGWYAGEYHLGSDKGSDTHAVLLHLKSTGRSISSPPAIDHFVVIARKH